MNKVRFVLTALLITMASSLTAQELFVKVKDGQFVRNGKPYYFVGTNFWYGAILGSTGRGGDRQRLKRELDTMKRMGIDNLRIMVGSDGEEGVKTKVEPVLQRAPGVYNDTILDGLDYLLMEMERRGMLAILYLNNAWEWSGGYGYYLEQAGAGKAVRPNEVGYEAYMKYAAQFADNAKAQQLFYDHVRFIMSRTNKYTGRRYCDEPSIMSWQIGNEPRAFSKAALPGFERWLSETSALMKSIDNNHLVSIGSEGVHGCEGSYDVYRRICADPNVDYCNIHIWPYNWGWAKQDSLAANLERAKRNTDEYIGKHIAICEQLHKPLVLEEFGFPRDGFSFSKSSSTNSRDEYYRHIFTLIGEHAAKGSILAGCNFWGWGGYAEPQHEQWEPGDDYTGDPAQEAQGLNSVFMSDKSTIKMMSKQIKQIRKRIK